MYRMSSLTPYVKNVSKRVFLDCLVCPTLGWLARSAGFRTTELTLGERFRMEQGIHIGKRARKLYPEGVLVVDVDTESALESTKTLMGDPSITVIFEGAFMIDGFTARADILKREDGSWHMIEVKSSVNDKEEFIDDMAYTTMVIDRCGLDICSVSLVLVSREFRLGMGDERLFVEIDHTDEVLERVEVFKSSWEQVETITKGQVKPEPQLQLKCGRCEVFRECLGKDIENSIFDVRRLSQSKFDQLKELGVVRLEDIPEEFPLTGKQARVRNCVQAKKPLVGDRLEGELMSISWPTCYLDFETVMTAMPLYPEVAPYTQLPIQYSIHRCSEPGTVIDHFEYLADPSRDCRRELAGKLIDDLKGEENIIVYSSFEKTVIRNLALLFPDLAPELNLLADRLVDLEVIIRKNFDHPGFHGSTSIKVTLPVLVADMSYDELAISDGSSAMAAFAYLAIGKYGDDEVETIRRDLLEYCAQDTLAMVRLHQRLSEYVRPSSG